ncbi:DUF4168 domain-containing protein [Pseudidiomarina gelatinasegens]|uniref:DUF4168 domain-containing protein n=1 Tax=Pseudidiomarina gelatinasegens TaxID=2487740 RepID=A0A443YZL6_9GAMM|nr:DUF4168 domain-containing protein [Pseudidiomarina gelatinasegens]RWU09666.1 DUF4168 domain-containing protein [Pseudidiomarina gelatinasegens]
MRKTMTALAIAALFSSSAAMAAPQEGQSQQQQMMQQQESIELTDTMLEQFVTAMSNVQEISNKYSEQFQSAEDAEQAQEIQRKAQEEMVAAVNDSGLSPQEYNTIVQRVQQDEELRARLQEMTE